MIPAHQSRATGEIAIVHKRIRAIVQNPIALTDNRRTHNPVTGLVINIRLARARCFCAGGIKVICTWNRFVFSGQNRATSLDVYIKED